MQSHPSTLSTMAAIPPQQPGAQQPAIQQAGQLPAAQQPAAQQPAAQQPAAQQPAVQLPGAQTTAIPAAQPGIQPHAQTTDILAANPNPVKPETKADAKTETQAGLSLGLGGLTTSAPATSTVVKHKDVKPTPSLTEAATKARESASPTLSAEEMVTTVLDVAGKPTQQREGQCEYSFLISISQRQGGGGESVAVGCIVRLPTIERQTLLNGGLITIVTLRLGAAKIV